MTASFEAFTASTDGLAPPPGLSTPLEALWWTAKGRWDAAHLLVQDAPGREAAWVHAHLHRREGDAGNARYWYRRAGCATAAGSFDTEWTEIAVALIAQASRGVDEHQAPQI